MYVYTALAFTNDYIYLLPDSIRKMLNFGWGLCVVSLLSRRALFVNFSMEQKRVLIINRSTVYSRLEMTLTCKYPVI